MRSIRTIVSDVLAILGDCVVRVTRVDHCFQLMHGRRRSCDQEWWPTWAPRLLELPMIAFDRRDNRFHTALEHTEKRYVLLKVRESDRRSNLEMMFDLIENLPHFSFTSAIEIEIKTIAFNLNRNKGFLLIKMSFDRFSLTIRYSLIQKDNDFQIFIVIEDMMIHGDISSPIILRTLSKILARFWISVSLQNI